jgi:hypothetical protein
LTKYLAVLFLLMILIVFSSGCDSSLPSGTPNSPTTSPPMVITEPPRSTYAPYSTRFSFSPEPILGVESEVTFSSTFTSDFKKQKATGLANARARVDFFWTDIHGSYSEAKKSTLVPISEVLVSGLSTWEGNALDGVELRFTIKLPKEGYWRVVGSMVEADSSNGIQGIAWGDQWMIVADGTYQGRGDNVKAGSLAYLHNFQYGQIGDKQLDERGNPVIMVSDIAKAPLVGEAVEVSCTITSLNDVAGFSMLNRIEKRESDTSISSISSSRLMKEGSLVWQGNLKAREPVVVTGVILFPEAGEWEIRVEGNSQANELNQEGGYGDILDLTVGEKRSSYGWVTLYPGPDATERFIPKR